VEYNSVEDKLASAMGVMAWCTVTTGQNRIKLSEFLMELVYVRLTSRWPAWMPTCKQLQQQPSVDPEAPLKVHVDGLGSWPWIVPMEPCVREMVRDIGRSLGSGVEEALDALARSVCDDEVLYEDGELSVEDQPTLPLPSALRTALESSRRDQAAPHLLSSLSSLPLPALRSNVVRVRATSSTATLTPSPFDRAPPPPPPLSAHAPPPQRMLLRSGAMGAPQQPATTPRRRTSARHTV